VENHELRFHRSRPRATQIKVGGASERAHAITTPPFDDGRAAITFYKLSLPDLLGDQEDASGIRIQSQKTVMGDLPITSASVLKKLSHHLYTAKIAALLRPVGAFSEKW